MVLIFVSIINEHEFADRFSSNIVLIFDTEDML
jgi:hypothetical protein